MGCPGYRPALKPISNSQTGRLKPIGTAGLVGAHVWAGWHVGYGVTMTRPKP